MKKALLIGINYIGTKNELNGCINDIVNIKKYLIESGYSEDNMLVMTEVAKNPQKIPTKKNIIDGIKWLVENVNEGDQLYMHYSGHGGSIKDFSGDETDGLDEVIFPLNGYIVDDKLRKILVDKIPRGVSLTCIFDCCHSGTVLDLRYNYKVDVSKNNPKYDIQIDTQYKNTEGEVILLSGCKDDQTSADSYEKRQFQGAMTYSFLETMKLLKSEEKDPTYKNLIKNLTKFIKKRGYTQVPQLSSGCFLDLEKKFSL